MQATTIAYAFFGGLLPSFIWLYFLLKEDAKHHEPKRLITYAFLAGMLAVPLALPLEQYAKDTLGGGVNVMASWAIVEELLKYIMAATFILWRRAVSETPDYIIYMITVALGFAALENMLFLIAPLSRGEFATAFFTGNLRFLGSTLLHVVASAAIGVSFALSASLKPPMRVLASAAGLILAITLHTAFNLLIMNEGTSTALLAFFLVWSLAVVLFAVFEVVKYFKSPNFPNYPYQQ